MSGELEEKWVVGGNAKKGGGGGEVRMVTRATRSLDSGEILWVEWTGIAERLHVGVRETEGSGKMEVLGRPPTKMEKWSGFWGGEGGGAGRCCKGAERDGNGIFSRLGTECHREGWGVLRCLRPGAVRWDSRFRVFLQGARDTNRQPHRDGRRLPRHSRAVANSAA